MISADQISEVLFIFFLSSARMIALFMVVPFLSRQSLGSNMIRNGLVASFSLVTFPIVEHTLPLQALSGWETLVIIGKEIFIGLAMGFIISIPFWAIESAGFLVDNQRGATMASALNPLSGSQTSPLGILLSQAMVTLFFISGAFLLMLYSLYLSYKVWPVFSFFPTVSGGGGALFLSQLDTLMRLTLLLGGPVVIVMFLFEFGLALISRFAPQLNVFILSLPIKSAVGIAFLCLYAGYILTYFSEMMLDMPNLLAPLFEALGGT